MVQTQVVRLRLQVKETLAEWAVRSAQIQFTPVAAAAVLVQLAEMQL
jgi:hypothetical protein